MTQLNQENKADAGKSRLDLITPQSQFAIGDVLAFGAEKYEENTWQEVEPKRYEAAMLRHYNAWKLGEELDQESGLPHLDHMLTNAMFLQYFGTQSSPKALMDKLKRDEVLAQAGMPKHITEVPDEGS